MTKLNFDLIKGKYAEIINHPHANLVEITFNPTDERRDDDRFSIWIDYKQFVSLVDTLQSIEISRPSHQHVINQ